MMLVVVSYDVSTTSPDGRRRLRRMAKQCQNFGQRVQKSVFECWVDNSQWTDVRHRLIKIMNEKEDSLRFYHLGAAWKGRVEHLGSKASPEPDEPLLV